MMIMFIIIKVQDVPSIDIIDFDFPEWHTVDDTIESCSPKPFIVGNVLINFIVRKTMTNISKTKMDKPFSKH